jgi:hypothetical protein
MRGFKGYALVCCMLLGVVGCQSVDASKDEVVASAEWFEAEKGKTESRVNTVDERMQKLEQDIKELQSKPSEPTPSPVVFTDLPSNYFALDEISFLANRGVIKGYSDGSFRPNQTITRAQTATMLVRELGLSAPSNYQLKATDVSPQHDAYESLRIAEYHGLMTGRDGKLLPGEGLKRSQMAVLLDRAFDLEVPSQTYPFTDITSDYPNFKEINIIAHNRITTEVNKAFRPNETTTRTQFSLFLARAIHEPFRP